MEREDGLYVKPYGWYGKSRWYKCGWVDYETGCQNDLLYAACRDYWTGWDDAEMHYTGDEIEWEEPEWANVS